MIDLPLANWCQIWDEHCCSLWMKKCVYYKMNKLICDWLLHDYSDSLSNVYWFYGIEVDCFVTVALNCNLVSVTRLLHKDIGSSRSCKKWHRNMHLHFLLTSTTGETQELEDGLIAPSFNVLSTSSIVCRIARGTQYGCYLFGGASPTFTSCSKT